MQPASGQTAAQKKLQISRIFYANLVINFYSREIMLSEKNRQWWIENGRAILAQVILPFYYNSLIFP